MGLKEEIEVIRPVIRTDSYPMSIGEWISIYERNEIDIHPEFQRFYRWSEIQRTHLIESILLGIPIPPIFVSQRDDGVWDVIDGLQRLSTIFQLVGILKNEDGSGTAPLVLQKTDYLPSLEGKVWDAEGNDNELGTPEKLLIKRAKLHVNIIEKESDSIAKYELFQRLNTGGALLSKQELRNCILVMLNDEFYNWMNSLSEHEAFRTCVPLTERAMQERYDLELVLRFLVLRNLTEDELTNIGDLGEFLTNRMRDLATDDNYNYAEEEEAFRFTFALLAGAVGEDAFRKYDAEKERFTGSFYITPYEVFAIGIGSRYEELSPSIDVLETIKRFWTEEFDKIKVSGVTASSRIPVTIAIGRRIF